MSLIHEQVYNIPMLFLIGWRGEPNKKDEPQHISQGECTQDILNVCGLKYRILPDHIDIAKSYVDSAVK